MLYPDGYASYEPRLTMAQVQSRHRGKMETEYARRFFAAMEAANGLVGIGGGWRAVQPAKPGFAPDGKSFHQTQQWKDGQLAYAAVDIVGVNARHGEARAWMERHGAKFGLRTFLNVNQEPWHIQAIDMPAGWSAWVNLGRPNPKPRFPLPGDIPPWVPPTPPKPGPPLEAEDMHLTNPPRRLIDTRQGGKSASTLLACQTGLDPTVVKAVRVNITVVPQGVAGFCSNDGATSYCQFGQGAPADHEKAFALNSDGTISLGASTPVHWIIDLVEEYR